MLASHRGKAPPRCTCTPPAPSRAHSGRVAGAAGTALGGMIVMDRLLGGTRLDASARHVAVERDAPATRSSF